MLIAGDGFVTADVVERALARRGIAGLDIRHLVLPWPVVPFGPVAEVQEASGVEDDLIDALDGVQVAVTQMAPFTERVIASAPDLRLIVVCRGGPVNVNLRAAGDAGVKVISTPGRNAPAAAEHTVALIMAALHRLVPLHADMQAGLWRGDEYSYDACRDELAGLCVGLVGHGAIGARVAHILSAFEARVLICDPYVTQADVRHGTLVGLDDLLSRSAVLSLHARLTAQTRGMIGAAQLTRLPRGAVVVNTARGPLIDHQALIAALHSGHLGGAALDVYDPEPPAADDPIRAAPRILLTPHLAGATRQTAHRAADQAADAVDTFIRSRNGSPGSALAR